MSTYANKWGYLFQMANFISMKRVLVPLAMSLILCSCVPSNIDVTKKPSDTNLKFWIGQDLTEDDLKGFTAVNGDDKYVTYLDKDYQMAEKNGMPRRPDKYVTYEIRKSEEAEGVLGYVVNIEIEDESIYVYGLSMRSSSQEVDSKMKSMGFEYQDMDMVSICDSYYLKDRLCFWAYPNYMRLYCDSRRS